MLSSLRERLGHRVARRGRVTIEVPKVGDPEIFEREMGELGIHAMRREPSRNRQRLSQ